ncbi:MAG TPA: NUDIX domain-containing protein [Candidatus Saccharimonadales bacterium]
MAKHSAGILLCRKVGKEFEVLLVHPGGPLWARKDLGAWSIPKGELEEGEELLDAARREFAEEMGAYPPAGDYMPLSAAKQASGKTVHAFALESGFNLERFHSNMFQMEWPPSSGKQQEFPENDKAAWLPFAAARQKLVKGQVPLLQELADRLGVALDDPGKPGH